MLRLARLTLRERVASLLGTLAATAVGAALTISAFEVLAAAEGATRPGHATHAQRLAGAAGEYLLGLMALIVAFATVFVVAGTASYATAVRRRELGLLRATGATPWQIRRLIVGESALVALCGGALGALGSPLVGPALVAWLSSRGMMPSGVHPAISPAAIPFGCGLMIAVSVPGAWPAANRCAKIAPSEALREAELDHRAIGALRWLAGIGCLGLAVYVVGRAVGGDIRGMLAVTSVEAVLVVLGLGLLAPVVVPAVTRVVPVPHGLEGWIARRHARIASRRGAAMAAPIMLVIGLTAALGTVVDTAQAGVSGHVADPTSSTNMNPVALQLIVGIVLLYVAVALAGTAVTATAARSRELVALRLTGATRGQVLTAVASEAVLISLAGIGLGLLTVVGGLVGRLSAGQVGRPPVIPWGWLAVVTAVCVTVSAAAAAIAAARGPAGVPRLPAGAGT